MIQGIRFVVVLSLLAVVLAAPSDSNPHCIHTSRQCVRNSECCEACCSGGKCVTYSDSCIAAASPCSTHACQPGQKCYLQQVQCIQAPCDPLPACKSNDPDYADYE